MPRSLNPRPEFSGEFEAPPIGLGYVVYQLIDHMGVCFYVGYSKHVFTRIGDHGKNPMRSTPYRVKWEWFSERQDALDREGYLIRTLDPSQNTIGRMA